MRKALGFCATVRATSGAEQVCDTTPMRRFQGGLFTMGHVRGIPIRVHWATPVGALLLTQFRFRPPEWILFAGVILLHELAHAGAARALRVRVFSADLMPWGGQCLHATPRTSTQLALIAAAGPAVHLALFSGAMILLRTGAYPPGARGLVDTLGAANFFLALVNLLPLRPLDGAEAWKLLPIAARAGWRLLRDVRDRARLASMRRAKGRRRPATWAVMEGTGEDDRNSSEPPRWVN